MRLTRIYVNIVMIVLFSVACSKKEAVSQTENNNSLRVLGYLFSNNNWATDLNNIDLSRITDINLAFINPDATGSFPANDAYRQVIQKAHAQKVRVFLSLGGGDPPPHLAGLLKNDKRAGLVAGLVSVAETYDFDGIDVDLENSLINNNYAAFVSELSIALKAKKRLMTAALATWNSSLINDATLQLYDFINIMSYDKTGPWDLSNPGPHSPLAMAQDDFNYYNKTRKIAAEKLFIGLPFYGYGFGNGAPESLTYREIINAFPGAENSDAVTLPPGGTVYYNGIATIQQKVNFAITNKAGGVMIWQLLGDSKDSKSLLKAINDIKNK